MGDSEESTAPATIQSVQPPWLSSTYPATVSPDYSGQLDMLAQQLAKGGYGYGNPVNTLATLESSHYYPPGSYASASPSGQQSATTTVSKLPDDAVYIPGSSFAYNGYDFVQYQLGDGSFVNYPVGPSSSASTATETATTDPSAATSGQTTLNPNYKAQGGARAR